MKKIIIGVIVLLLLFSMIGGGGKKDSGKKESASSTESVAEESNKEEAAPAEVSGDQEEAEPAEVNENQEEAGSDEEKEHVEAEETAEAEAEESVEYTEVSVQEMIDDLESNALKAKDNYEGQYLEITGYLNNIDSGGDYITLYADEYSFTGVQCFAKKDNLKNQIANMSIGDTVTLRGKCTGVGEILGYSVEIESIDGYEEESEDIPFDTTDDGYIIVSANDLVELIGENPLQAQKTFKGKKIELSGKLGTIDSSGKYIGIDSDDEWSFVNIQCFVKNDDQKAQIMDMSSGDEITLRGKCTSVGELLGYSIDIESIE